MRHNTHTMDVCEFGIVHTQCRCMDKNKTVNKITCDRPGSHAEKARQEDRFKQMMNAPEGSKTPKLNDDVHYVAYGTPKGEYPSNVCRAAKITETPGAGDDEYGLFVMNPKGVFFNPCKYDANKYLGLNEPGTFHYSDECANGE